MPGSYAHYTAAEHSHWHGKLFAIAPLLERILRCLLTVLTFENS
jgi:hypothetical protein